LYVELGKTSDETLCDDKLTGNFTTSAHQPVVHFSATHFSVASVPNLSKQMSSSSEFLDVKFMLIAVAS